MYDDTYPARLALAALYLPGLERAIEPSRRYWPATECIVCRFPDRPSLAAAELRRAGMSLEAMLLEDARLLLRAERVLARGFVLTAACPGYPPRWRQLFGAAAPPALWRRGEMPSRPCFSIVGSRHVPAEVKSWCEDVAREALSLGFSICSGAAVGCDHAALGAAGEAAVSILPHGLDHAPRLESCLLSACPPPAEFSSAAAMERNALIYSIGGIAAVGHARFKQGGTWIGAVTALRRRLCRLIVRGSDSPATRALVALGASPLSLPGDLLSVASEPGCQPALTSLTI
jgi:predicted Rossmann fold nucleotide-binding protein DprA/Smf involved in DNA uptake